MAPLSSKVWILVVTVSSTLNANQWSAAIVVAKASKRTLIVMITLTAKTDFSVRLNQLGLSNHSVANTMLTHRSAPVISSALTLMFVGINLLKIVRRTHRSVWRSTVKKKIRNLVGTVMTLSIHLKTISKKMVATVRVAWLTSLVQERQLVQKHQGSGSKRANWMNRISVHPRTQATSVWLDSIYPRPRLTSPHRVQEASLRLTVHVRWPINYLVSVRTC